MTTSSLSTFVGSWQCQLCNSRIQGLDLSKCAVLPGHMDTAYQKNLSASTSTKTPPTTTTAEK